MGSCNNASSVLAPSSHSVPGYFVNNVQGTITGVHIINITLERIAKKKNSDLQMETAGCSTGEDLVAKKRGVGWGSCLLGSHHWTLSPRLLYSRSEWKLLLPACQERRRLHPGLGNTHSHKLQPFFGKN